MKKTTKGAIAAGAAAVLLAGGAGSFAAWNSSATINGGEVEAGHLKLTAADAGNWTWAGGGEFDPEEALLVPGDSVQYTADYTISAAGDNLEATLSSEVDNVGGNLAQYLTTDTNVGGVTGPITADNDGDTVTVTTTITFKSDTDGEDGQNGTADLGDATVKLEQTIN